MPKKSPADRPAARAAGTSEKVRGEKARGATGSAASSGDESLTRLPLDRYFAYFGLATVGCSLDLLTKEAVFRWRGLPRADNEWWIVEPYFGIETAVNRGALFGMGAGYWWVFATLSVLALLGIFTWLFAFRAAIDRWLTVALGLVSGGILGNLYDRLGLWDASGLPAGFEHGVRDWILFRYGEWTWPNFNIADSLLVTGAIMLVVHAFVWRETPKPEGQAAAPEGE